MKFSSWQGPLRTILVCISTLAGQLCAQAPPPSNTTTTKAPDVSQQVRSVIDPLVDGPVATESRAYYVGEMLIVPLHAAFLRNDPAWQKDFAGHFQRLMQSKSVVTGFNELSRLQYLYLASQFLVVAKSTGHSDLIPAGLPDYLFNEIHDTWYERPAWQYAHAPFHGRRESVLFKLNLRNPEKSYYRAMMDWDFFLFAITADLKNYAGTSAQQQSWKSTLDDILGIADKVCRQEIKPTANGGWLLQPGVWTDHPDFQYAGNARAERGIRPVPVRDVAWDTSHFLRAPLWITSMIQAYPPGDPEREYYANLRKGLTVQFFSKVLVPPSSDFPCYRLTNYMDGSNGVFRWGYGSLGANNGYGPYQASGTLMLGSLAFLGTTEGKETYRHIADSYPWPRQCVELYLGPTSGGRAYTSAELNPDSSTMRLYHVLAYLAAEL